MGKKVRSAIKTSAKKLSPKQREEHRSQLREVGGDDLEPLLAQTRSSTAPARVEQSRKPRRSPEEQIVKLGLGTRPPRRRVENIHPSPPEIYMTRGFDVTFVPADQEPDLFRELNTIPGSRGRHFWSVEAGGRNFNNGYIPEDMTVAPTKARSFL